MTQTLTTDELRDIVANAKTSLEQYLALELLANREAHPVEYQSRTKPNWDKKYPWSNWERCSEGTYNDLIKANFEICDWIYEIRRLFTAPPLPAAPEGGK